MSVNNVELSSKFKRKTVNAIGGIVAFVVIYIILVTVVVGITATLSYFSFKLLLYNLSFITIAIALASASIGFLILIFLFKFLFSSKKVDRSHLVEITRKDEPELFALIDQVVDEVGSRFPKKIYLSAQVNASVFYDSNFWSMFLPIKKNLNIGLGLVNTVTTEEFKAILCHEFGHFSQKSMKVGSYVYTVNQVIHNLLFENDGFERFVISLSNVGNIFAIAVAISIQVINGIQWILRKMYEVVNTSYMGLSREMEFHADDIAGSITGSAALRDSLLRMNLADFALNSVLSYYETKIVENLKSQNVFKEQTFVMTKRAELDNIQIENGLPHVTIEAHNKFNKSKLKLEDQWASHPSLEDRIENLNKFDGKKSSKNDELATILFKNIEKVEIAFTEMLFDSVEFKGEVQLNSLDNFRKDFDAIIEQNSFPVIFNGYYDDYNTQKIELYKLTECKTHISPELCFGEEMIEKIYIRNSLEQDVLILQQIKDKVIKVRTFDYDGIKYKRKSSADLLTKIQAELQQVTEELLINDQTIFQCFLEIEEQTPNKEKLVDYYTQCFDYNAQYEEKVKLLSEISASLDFIHYQHSTEDVKVYFRTVAGFEAKLKNSISTLISDKIYGDDLKPEMVENFEKYLSKNWSYFGITTYYTNNLEVLYKAINDYGFLIGRKYFLLKKQMLSYQANLANIEVNVGH